MPRLLLSAAVLLLALDKPADDIIDDAGKGTKFRLVALGKEDEKLDGQLFWRTHAGSVAARVAPIRFRLGDAEVIAPILNPKAETSGREAHFYPTEGRVKLEVGKHTLRPGGIPVEVKGVETTSDHPAVKIVKGEVLIRCAPVRLEVVDERGAPVPTPLKLGDERDTFLREEARFSVLIAYLPVGGEYSSSLGTFRVAADGKVKGVRLAPGVGVTAEGLRKTVPVEPTPSLAAAPEMTRLAAPGKSCRLFIPSVAVPGQPLLLAVSRAEYRKETQADIAADHFAFAIPDGPALPLEKADPTPDMVSRATRALNVKADDLAWLAPRLPASVLGPIAISTMTRFFGNHSFATLALNEGKLHIVPHRWRTVFDRTETAGYSILLPRGAKKGEAKVLAQIEGRKEPVTLGKLSLPAVEDRAFDSRLFTLNVNDLPPGKHQLWIDSEMGASGKTPLHVVSLAPRSPFFTHSMSGCTACWPTTEEGMQVLEDANLEMVAATGSFSNIDTRMPAIDSALAARLKTLGLPADLALTPTSNDRLLERLLRHRLKFIDMTVVRASGFYMEGLSYHHSYKPSVDRMVRRMQLFTQQTADYPSMWGVNYSWFPQLYGYAEGGVPTDAHVGERNRALEANAKAAGFKPLTRDETEWLAKNKAEPKERERVLALMRQAIAWRNATQELGWGKQNKLYNDAVRQVKPDMALTLFENAGHDEPKRLASMFKDMCAQCYESYTDFGDWPMSAAFVTDWSKGQSPGQPVWLTTCWGTSEEGKMKSLFHAFARGLDGGGVPMQGTFPLATLERRAKGLRFLSQYGAVAKHAKPDGRVAILARDSHAIFGRLIWDAHAVYSHLTRLGYPPVILHGDTASKGIAESVKVLVLVKEEMPLEPELRKAIDGFQKRGGKVVVVGPCADAIDGAINVKDTPKHLWELKGFHPESHEAMWAEFERLRAPLGEAMRKADIAPLATMDPARGFAVCLDAGPVRYVSVISDVKSAHSNVFEPSADILLSLEGVGWKVRDLAKQTDLKTEEKDGRTLVKVDLATEPTTLLALYRSAPGKITLKEHWKPHLHSVQTAQVKLHATDNKPMPHVPVRIIATSPSGRREERFAAAGMEIQFDIAISDEGGVWQFQAQELFTGLAVTVEQVVSGVPRGVIEPAGDVHVVNRRQLAAFAERPGEKLVLVEPGQSHLLPSARRLVESLKKAGKEARLWQVRPEEYDTHPIRWQPTETDKARLAEIDAGRLIGVRQSLTAFIDTVKRVHVPERGGYADVDPPYMVGKDCIVFSGGWLAESLRAVSSWSQPPLGKGQSRIAVCFSPFAADRQAVAVTSDGAAGVEAATDELALQLANKQPEAQRKPRLLVITSGEEEKPERLPVPTPYLNYSPIQRVERLLVAPDGSAALFLKGKHDNLAFVDAQGVAKSTLHVDPLLAAHARLDHQGHLRMPFRKVTATHPGWNFPTEIELTLRSVAPDGKIANELPAYRGAPGLPDFEGGIRWSDDGQTAFLGRPGGFLWKTKDDKAWRRFDDEPSVRFSLLYPRQPVGATFSPDGRHVLFTMDSRPPFGGLNSSNPNPWTCETILFDLQKGERIWSLKAPDGKATYAIHTGFAALSKDAALAAFADYDGTLFLVDRQGKSLWSEKASASPNDAGGRVGPHEGVGVSLSIDGKTALFAFRAGLVAVRDLKATRIPLPGVTSACLGSDVMQIVAGCGDGSVRTFDLQGKPLWTYATKGAGPFIAARPGMTLVATGAGKLIALNGEGKAIRETDVVAAADKGKHPLPEAPASVRMSPPVEYVEPNTLALAKEKLGAKEIARWKPSDEGTPRFGRFFHAMDAKAELSAGEPGDYFVHIVYRRPASNKSLKLAINGKDGPETFILDLPTPEYRVIDIPLRGPKAKATLTIDGAAEIAEFSLWSMKWPGPNLAYVRPAGVEGKPPEKGDDILDDLEGKKSVSGKLKNCKVWWPNTDFDGVRGPWLPAPLDPLAVVDGRRFHGGKLSPWCAKYLNFPPCKGGFFTVDLTEEQSPTLLATYDRASKQSEVCAQLAVFRPDVKEPLTGGPLLGGVQGNDQFWRLISLAKGKVRVLGIHLFKDDQTGVGLGEMELYK